MRDTFPERDDVIRASRFAIARAKRRESELVTPDDLLSGLLQAASRFGVVLLGPWVIDLEELGEGITEEADGGGSKVAYAPETAALFDLAAAIARRDWAPHVELVHMLAAFANEKGVLMGRLQRTYGIDSVHWRAALARWQPVRSSERGTDGSPDSTRLATPVRELLSPDEAAEFLGVHTQTVRGYIRSGKLPAHRLAGERVLRIRRQDLLALLEPYEPD